jgi:ribonuclease D
VQVAVGSELAIIDTLSVKDMKPFWRTLADGDHQTIVHSGREEIGFSLSAIDAVPANLFDLQIAAGLIGLEYPAGYGSLMQKLLDKAPAKGETRTDWRRRPLTEHQLQYALNDVIYLEPMRDRLAKRLAELNRTGWLDEEMSAWLQQVHDSFRRERWRRVSGITGLSPRSKAIVRELWQWREKEAERRNMPVRRVLRDDLIVELAKRQIHDTRRIRAVRGMDRGDLNRALPALADCVRRAVDLPDDELPRTKHRKPLPRQINMLGQFISSALASLCHRAELAPSIVGNPSDVRELIAYRLGFAHDEDESPALSRGWRAKVVGSVIDDLLAGKTAIRIEDPKSDEPLAFVPLGSETT